LSGVKTSRRVPLLVPLLALVSLLSACSTTKIDWNSRVGTYTYDQALVDLGPPDKLAKLSDGGTVAEWLICRGYSGGTAGMYYGHGYYPYYHGYYSVAPYYYSAPSPDTFLRLTFGPDDKLQVWKKFSR
jgi:hypothetical protein